MERLWAELKTVNEALWEIEDDIRQCEAKQDFGLRFIELARSVYRTNDRREGLLDRLGNPRPLFHVARILNTLLFSGERRWRAAPNSDPSAGRLELVCGGESLTLISNAEVRHAAIRHAEIAAAAGRGPAILYDLMAGTSTRVAAGSVPDFSAVPAALLAGAETTSTETCSG